MRGERTGGGTAVHHLQHGSLHLDEVEGCECGSKRRDGRGAREHRGPCLVANNQVEVSRPHACLFAQLFVQVGQRQKGLGGYLPGGCHDGELAPSARDDLARYEQVVTEVDQFLPELERFLAHLGE